MAGNGREGGSTLLFTLAWPWASKKSRSRGSTIFEESSFASLAQDNATCSFFKNELELLEYTVEDDGEPPVADESFKETPLCAHPSGSMMRAILRDELYRAASESATCPREAGTPAVTPGRRLSVQFVDPQSRNSTLRVDIGRRVMWGNVDVKEFEREKEWSPQFEEQVTRIKDQHNGAELEAVYKLLVDEFATEKPAFIITSGGKKFRAAVCITNQQLLVRRDPTQTMEVTAWVSDVSSVRFGVSKAYVPYLEKENNVHLCNENCLSISFTSARRRNGPSSSLVAVSQSGGVLIGLCFVFETEAERNSFALLIRTMNRVVQRNSIGDWEDAIEELDTVTEETEEETQPEETKRETETKKLEQPDHEKEQRQTGEASADKKQAVPRESEKEVDLQRLIQCLNSLATGMQVKKVTRKGTLVNRKLSLAGASLQLVSLNANKGQIVGVFDDVVYEDKKDWIPTYTSILFENFNFTKTEAGQDDACFEALKAKQQLPAAELCAVVKLTDHSFALIFKSQQQRDKFVYAMTHLHESDELLKYY